MSEEKSPADRLRDMLTERFGDDWRRDVSLTLRADALYWLVYLAGRGIEARRQEFRGDPEQDKAGAAASLASWTMDLENLLDKVRAAVVPPRKGGKAKGK